jgi:predicted extracellular nuclease
LIGLAALQSCGKDTQDNGDREYLLTGEGWENGSTTAGNFVATAIQDTYDLEIVMYPSPLVRSTGMALLDDGEAAKNEVLNLYPDEGAMDELLVGTMKGKYIKSFIMERAQLVYGAELQVAGLRYDIHFVGGIPRIAHFTREDGGEIDDDAMYRVAVSNYFYMSGKTFPGYRYGNSLEFDLKQTGKIVSTREAVEAYLNKNRPEVMFDMPRVRVTKHVRGDAGSLTIAEIQSDKHLSPYFGYKAKTQGIVIGIGIPDRYPGGTEIYLQDDKESANAKNSTGLFVYVPDEDLDVESGDKIEIFGTIYEETNALGMSRTSMRDVESLKVLSKNNPLPKAVALGKSGRKIPDQKISSYHGDLNLKPSLNLQDGIDFWESLEGMRVSIKNPRVVGFIGGHEVYLDTKTHLTLFVAPENVQTKSNLTPTGGMIVDAARGDFNPEIIQIPTHVLAKDLKAEMIFNIGDKIEGELTGILSYDKNIFGDGNYVLILTGDQPALQNNNNQIVPLNERPKSTIKPAEDKLTIASYNVENLGGQQADRIARLSEVISQNLGCPDILNLVEIQDNNGEDFAGDSRANETLAKIVDGITCPNADYRPVNIDPILNAEGGQPGGNIRVSMLYNKNRVQFEPRGNPGPLTETIVLADGSLSTNPGRVFPNDPDFMGTRKSLAAEFIFRGEKVYVIGNHLNSKLGDTSHWGNIQPSVSNSEKERTRLAAKLRKFVQLIERNNPRANIAMMGDFNAFTVENSMRLLESAGLSNLTTLKIPENGRYTTIYNGNSQSLDYIMVNGNMLGRNPQYQILHINSDFMERMSDHDPLVSQFDF